MRSSVIVCAPEAIAPPKSAASPSAIAQVIPTRARFPEIIRDVRGRGLLIGVEIVDAKVGKSLAQRLFDRNVLVAYTLNKPEVIRIEPPLIITSELIDLALERFEESLLEESKH